jgi:hypothetical protein
MEHIHEMLFMWDARSPATGSEMKRNEPGSLRDDADLTTHLSMRLPIELAVWTRARARIRGVAVSAVVRDALYAEKAAEEGRR